MNLRDLTYLVAVAELGHFGKAAERCFVSQPTLSGQIKKLEENLGVKLFERTNRKVMVTDIGKKIVNTAKHILNEADKIREIAALAQDPRGGTFRLGAFPTLSTYLFPSLVAKIKATLPDLRLILVEEKTDRLIEQLKAGEIDAALLALPIAEDGLDSNVLFIDNFRLAVPADHALNTRKKVTMDELSNHRLLLLEEGHCLRDQAMEVCQLAGSSEQDFRATGLETLRQMVRAGTGITLMPEIAIQQEDSAISYLAFKGTAPSRTIGLVWRKTTSRGVVMKEITDLLVAP